MKLFLISQDINNDYDTFDSAVVAAEDENDARHIHPGRYENTQKWWEGYCDKLYASWVLPEDVKVEYLGETDRSRGVICASYNAG